MLGVGLLGVDRPIKRRCLHIHEFVRPLRLSKNFRIIFLLRQLQQISGLHRTGWRAIPKLLQVTRANILKSLGPAHILFLLAGVIRCVRSHYVGEVAPHLCLPQQRLQFTLRIQILSDIGIILHIDIHSISLHM